MNFTILGGDARTLELVSLLRQDGHELFPFALERKLPCTPEPVFDGAQAVILPLPCEKNGALFAPFSDTVHAFSTLFGNIPPKTRIFAGKCSPELLHVCARHGLEPEDYFLSEALVLRNAELTAEAAVSLLMSATGGSIMGSRSLVFGYGRIGRALSARLGALGSSVSVAARSIGQRRQAAADGHRALELWERPQADFVINTIPAPHVSAGEFPGAVCMELASPPYGFKKDEAHGAVMDGGALPGRYAPAAAAEIIRDTIYNMLGLEEKPWKS